MPSNMSSESFSLNNSKFLQYDAPDQKIFFISDELILLHKLIQIILRFKNYHKNWHGLLIVETQIYYKKLLKI